MYLYKYLYIWNVMTLGDNKNASKRETRPSAETRPNAYNLVRDRYAYLCCINARVFGATHTHQIATHRTQTQATHRTQTQTCVCVLCVAIWCVCVALWCMCVAIWCVCVANIISVYTLYIYICIYVYINIYIYIYIYVY